ncbi:MAG TPA: hypothetical protein VLB68_19740 [Pyrinomonadaceae bacterium]|nr:hypothetical protein [Pyrinomonadaceae bacterium]
MNGDPLLNQLRQFAYKLAEKNISLVIGGGYGLLLKAKHIQRTGARTRLDQIPIARSTGDIDVFLTAEVIVDKNRMAAIRQALDELGYSPVPGAEYYQFYREVVFREFNLEVSRNLKFDFLAAPVLGEQAKKVRSDVRRIRPRGPTETPMHAHTTPEAVTIEEHLISVDIGEAGQPIEVFLPHPFSYTLLKLFALRDQVDNGEKEFGRHHAFDIYTTWAMMTEEEFRQAENLRRQYADVGVTPEAIAIADALFADENAKGMIRLKEHARIERVELVELGEFIKDIRTLFLKGA